MGLFWSIFIIYLLIGAFALFMFKEIVKIVGLISTIFVSFLFVVLAFFLYCLLISSCPLWFQLGFDMVPYLLLSQHICCTFSTFSNCCPGVCDTFLQLIQVHFHFTSLVIQIPFDNKLILIFPSGSLHH